MNAIYEKEREAMEKQRIEQQKFEMIRNYTKARKLEKLL